MNISALLNITSFPFCHSTFLLVHYAKKDEWKYSCDLGLLNACYAFLMIVYFCSSCSSTFGCHPLFLALRIKWLLPIPLLCFSQFSASLVNKYIVTLTVLCLLIVGLWLCFSPVDLSVIFIVLQHPLPQGMFSKILQEFVESLRGISLLIMLQDLESKNVWYF